MAKVDIYAVETAGASGFGEGRVYLGISDITSSGDFRLVVTGALPHPFLSTTAIDIGGFTSEFSPVCGDPDGDANYDLRLHEFPFNAKPNHKDLFVGYDYMVALAHSHQPDFRSIREVERAFDRAPVNNPDGRTGITLHVLPGERKPEIEPIRFLDRGPVTAYDFDGN